MAGMKPELITDQTELAIIHLWRSRLAERVTRPHNLEFTIIKTGWIFESRFNCKDKGEVVDLRE